MGIYFSPSYNDISKPFVFSNIVSPSYNDISKPFVFSNIISPSYSDGNRIFYSIIRLVFKLVHFLFSQLFFIFLMLQDSTIIVIIVIVLCVFQHRLNIVSPSYNDISKPCISCISWDQPNE